MSSPVETELGTLVQRRPDVNGGRPCLAGTGFSVHQLSALYNEGARADEILTRHPELDLARIHAGIAYYLANRARIDAEVEEQAAACRKAIAQRKPAGQRPA